jgi:hypothetical protein
MSEPKPPRPTFNAMLICDHTIREAGTLKVSLIGIFGAIWSPVFPSIHSSLCVYANLGDAQGKYRFRLELLQADTMKVIGRGEGDVDIGDRMLPAEVVFELRGLAFDRPGRYEFNLYANDDLVGRKSFDVLQLKQPPGETR